MNHQSDHFLWDAGCLSPDAANSLTHSFHTLQPSAYKDGSYRLRRYSKFMYQQHTGRIDLLENDGFVQSSDVNRFQGNVARTYDDITEDTINSIGFAEMFQAFAQMAMLPEKVLIEVHQMRIIAKNQDEAESTPEGIHQDGFDRVGVFTIARCNAAGGELFVWRSQDDSQPAASQLPKSGDYCVLNDKIVWHSASPVAPVDSEKPGYWDLFVLTANKELVNELSN